MFKPRLRRYRYFPTLPDARALLALLRLNAIEFETRYQRGANFDRARHEPDQIEVWIRATDYAHVQRLEAALTREQAIALADDMLLDDQLQRLKTPISAYLTGTAGTISGPALSTSVGLSERCFIVLLLVTGLAALAYYWLKQGV